MPPFYYRKSAKPLDLCPLLVYHMTMDDKIKITVPKSLLQLLKKDCEEFDVKKANGTINFNAYINTLVVNFYEEFSASEEELHGEIRKALAVVPQYYGEKAFGEIVKLFSKRFSQNENKAESTTFAFKPTKQSEKAVIFIEHILLNSESISSFYRRMFLEYSRKTKNEREKILFKENYLLLKKAVDKQTAICLTLKNGDVIKEGSAYHIGSSKDELFNYVLLCDGKKNVTLRLSRIFSVSLLSAKANIPAVNAELFDRQIACAIQYPFYSTDREPIKVRLTEKGKTLFNKIYLYRPTPVSVNGDIYTFDCSANQLLYYFERFGEAALIISPKRLGVFMRNYYHFALKKYKELYK